MNTTSVCVIVGSFNSKNINELLNDKLRNKEIRLGPGRDLLKLLTDWPKEKRPTRRELLAFPSNNPEQCARLANFYELCAFAIKYPTFVMEVGEIECFDESIDKMAKEIQVHIAIPVFGIRNGEICIYLRDKKARSAEYKLGVI